jgi:hypothetical protein
MRWANLCIKTRPDIWFFRQIFWREEVIVSRHLSSQFCFWSLQICQLPTAYMHRWSHQWIGMQPRRCKGAKHWIPSLTCVSMHACNAWLPIYYLSSHRLALDAAKLVPWTLAPHCHASLSYVSNIHITYEPVCKYANTYVRYHTVMLLGLV